MNKQLRYEILKHIVTEFGLLKRKKINSLQQEQFLLKQKVVFEEEGGEIRNSKIWGAELKVQNQSLRILVSDFSDNNEEICLYLKMEDCPPYGLYFVLDDYENTMLAVMVDKYWMQCNTELQATFLAGVEKIRELPNLFESLKAYMGDYETLLSFVAHYDESQGSNVEPQEG